MKVHQVFAQNLLFFIVLDPSLPSFLGVAAAHLLEGALDREALPAVRDVVLHNYAAHEARGVVPGGREIDDLGDLVHDDGAGGFGGGHLRAPKNYVARGVSRVSDGRFRERLWRRVHVWVWRAAAAAACFMSA